jgi:peptidoglycan-associated lipoprotein
MNNSPKEEIMLTAPRSNRDSRSFQTQRSLAIAAGLAALFVLGGCHKKAAPPPPPPPLSNTGTTPTATITATPSSINAGDGVVLAWQTTDATDAQIDGLGPVPTAGTRTVHPAESMDYVLTAHGDGGSTTATAHVTVNTNTGNASNLSDNNITDELFHQNVKDVFFDYDSYDLNPPAQSTVSQDANFLNQHPGMKIVIGGYCDDRGSTEYNLALGENRANAAKQALVTAGVSPERLRTVSYGKEKQFCTEQTESCWQQNRRAQFSVDR